MVHSTKASIKMNTSLHNALNTNAHVSSGAYTATPAMAEAKALVPEPILSANGTRSNGAASDRDPRSGLVNQWHSQPRKIRIIHIGAGATGLCTAYKMRNKLENYELVCYEKNDSVGGTWFESEFCIPIR